MIPVRRPGVAGMAALCALTALLFACCASAVIAADTGNIRMPGKITIKALEDRFGPVAFDHEKHVMMAGACGKCHHLHNDKTVDACRTCHSLRPEDFRATATQGFLRCEGCHAGASVDSPGMPGLKVAFHKVCFSCHVGISGLGSTPKSCESTCHSRR